MSAPLPGSGEHVPINPSGQNSSAIWPPGSSILRLTLDARLQVYFHKMQHMAPRTCHPSVINQEARIIIHSLSSRTDKYHVQMTSKSIFLAGMANINYSRSVALLVHDIVTELQWGNWGAMRDFQEGVEHFTTEAIKFCWA
ncbi:hypothetical protein SERLA73DRAFT_190911, partial [Serpula lacrymans var. lacrymans S7.3]